MPPNPTATQRRSAALTICKSLGNELSVVATPLSQVDIRNIPNSTEPAVRNWIRTHAGRHEVYGSGAMATHRIHGRQPADLDIVIDNPRHAANALAGVMRGKGVPCKITPSKSPDAFVVQVKRRGEWVDALDIHPIAGHAGKYDFHGQSKPPMTANGINIQTAADQLLRKANAITQKGGAAPKRELKDTQDFISTAKMLLASIETRTAAQQARAKKVKAAIRVWESHLKTIKGAPPKPKRKQISKTRKTQYAKKAAASPGVNLDDLVFTSGDKVQQRKRSIGEIMGDTSSTPHPVGRDPYRARQPYGTIPTLGEAVSMKTKTRRRNPSRTKNKR